MQRPILVLGGAPGVLALPVMAFGGALIAAVTVLAIATLGQRATSIGIIMAGTATGYALSAVTSLLIFASDSPEAGRAVMFWLLGSPPSEWVADHR